MYIPDIVNAVFEGSGALFILNHCRVLFKDKMVAGVSVLSTAFFSSWGGWNLYYYLHLGQTYSWYAGMAICAANLLYLAMLVHYGRKTVTKIQFLP